MDCHVFQATIARMIWRKFSETYICWGGREARSVMREVVPRDWSTTVTSCERRRSIYGRNARCPSQFCPTNT